MEKELEKKIIRKGIFIFLIVGTIFGSIAGVTAYTISAKQIGYSPKDSSWKVNNVADAIESLKTLKGGSQNYSLDEQVVGTWIDGKPIYSKVLKITINNNENYTFSAKALISDDIDVMLNASGYSVTDNGITIAKFPCYYNNAAYSGVYMENNTKIIHIVTSSQYKTATHYINFQYTKTTDNATNS